VEQRRCPKSEEAKKVKFPGNRKPESHFGQAIGKLWWDNFSEKIVENSYAISSKK
jgi:hypothetical protein